VERDSDTLSGRVMRRFSVSVRVRGSLYVEEREGSSWIEAYERARRVGGREGKISEERYWEGVSSGTIE
jgi:hypothetical protein